MNPRKDKAPLAQEEETTIITRRKTTTTSICKLRLSRTAQMVRQANASRRRTRRVPGQRRRRHPPRTSARNKRLARVQMASASLKRLRRSTLLCRHSWSPNTSFTAPSSRWIVSTRRDVSKALCTNSKATVKMAWVPSWRTSCAAH